MSKKYTADDYIENVLYPERQKPKRKKRSWRKKLNFESGKGFKHWFYN